MNYRYVPESIKVTEQKIELSRRPGHYVTTIINPKPNPRDRVDDEYEDDNRSE